MKGRAWLQWSRPGRRGVGVVWHGAGCGAGGAAGHGVVAVAAAVCNLPPSCSWKAAAVVLHPHLPPTTPVLDRQLTSKS